MIAQIFCRGFVLFLITAFELQMSLVTTINSIICTPVSQYDAVPICEETADLLIVGWPIYSCAHLREFICIGWVFAKMKEKLMT